MNKNNEKIYDIAVVGGGASGMMAAITASRNGASVILVEKNAELGRKVLATGNGRCNLTNRLVEASRYHGGNPLSIQSVLSQFDQFKTMKFFENLGLVLKEENLGRIFPRTDEAKSVVDALIHEIEINKICTILNDQVRSFKKIGDIFEIILDSKHIIRANKLILTTGGKSAEHLGTSGDAYYWLQKMGHTITNLYPALAPLEIKETWIKDVQGLKIEAKLFTTVGGKLAYEKFGDLLFTHFGLSGPAAMAQAGEAGPYLGKYEVKVHLDLFPEQTPDKLDDLLKKIIDSSGAKIIKNILSGLIPANLAPIILDLLKINPEKKSAEISKNDRQNIVKMLKDIRLTVTATRPFKESQVTSGGVNLDEIDVKTLESKIVPGLYLAGEILDVDGDSGGFNLQWAWSSGHLAGNSSSK